MVVSTLPENRLRVYIVKKKHPTYRSVGYRCRGRSEQHRHPRYCGREHTGTRAILYLVGRTELTGVVLCNVPGPPKRRVIVLKKASRTSLNTGYQYIFVSHLTEASTSSIGVDENTELAALWGTGIQAVRNKYEYSR